MRLQANVVEPPAGVDAGLAVNEPIVRGGAPAAATATTVCASTIPATPFALKL